MQVARLQRDGYHRRSHRRDQVADRRRQRQSDRPGPQPSQGLYVGPVAREHRGLQGENRHPGRLQSRRVRCGSDHRAGRPADQGRQRDDRRHPGRAAHPAARRTRPARPRPGQDQRPAERAGSRHAELRPTGRRQLPAPGAERMRRLAAVSIVGAGGCARGRLARRMAMGPRGVGPSADGLQGREPAYPSSAWP